jgi:serine/threonine protein kinase
MTHFSTFGKYEIIRKLSRSMTDVYLAYDPELQRKAVVKIIEHSRDDFTQLIIEAERRGAELQEQLHKLDGRILEIYDFGEQSNCFFVAMQYFEGRTVAEVLKSEGPLEARRAASYGVEICNQLRSLHSFVSDIDGHKTAVVHGDIKPSNVQLGPNGEIRLLDFGIAKVITFTHNLTHHNLGSPSYCSPERISRSQVDKHSDLWAVGVSLYEMIAGEPPFQAQTTRKLENLIQSRRPPRPLPPTCPQPLQAIVAKALKGEVAQRYQSAEAFEDDLQAFLEGRQTVAETEPDEPAPEAAATVRRYPAESPGARTHLRGLLTSKPVFRVKGWNEFSNLAIALLAGILAGLLIFIPIAYYFRFEATAGKLRLARDYAHQDLQAINTDWNLYQELKARNQFLGRLSPVSSLDASMRSNLLAAANNILETYRNSSNPRLSDFDWEKARICLRRALEIEPFDSKAKGEAALCSGYLNLVQNAKSPKAALSIDNFRTAESYLPSSPDPHLALARVYIYTFHNVGEALAEYHQAEQLGFKLGPREAEQKADGYLFRAEWALARANTVPAQPKETRAKWFQLAQADMERASKLYEPILGFSNVSANLEKLRSDQQQQVELQALDEKSATAKIRYATRRWH